MHRGMSKMFFYITKSLSKLFQVQFIPYLQISKYPLTYILNYNEQ